MAHCITEREDGMFEFGYTGKPAWHGLGQKLEDGADIDTWKVQSGLDWTVNSGVVNYTPNSDMIKVFPGKKVLYRSDSNKPLSIVSDRFHIVQPGEVLEFFRDLTENHGMKLSAAGSLFGGTRFWATAELDYNEDVLPNDNVNSHLLLTTSVDGTLATTAKFCMTRTVCANTMAIALNENSNSVVRTTHKSNWNPDQVKIDLGILTESWVTFMSKIKTLTYFKMSENTINEFYKAEFYNPKLSANDQTWGVVKQVNGLMDLYRNGAGAEMATGTAWGALNAVTNMFTHGDGRKRDPSRMFWDSYNGKAAKIKDRVFNNLLKLAA